MGRAILLSNERKCVDKYLHESYTINALIVRLNSNRNSSKNNSAFSEFSEIQFTVINVLLEKSSIESKNKQQHLAQKLNANSHKIISSIKNRHPYTSKHFYGQYLHFIENSD